MDNERKPLLNINSDAGERRQSYRGDVNHGSNSNGKDVEDDHNSNRSSDSAVSRKNLVSQEILEIHADGLTTIEANIRLRKFGPNMVKENVTPMWKIFLLNFWGPMPILIEISILLSMINAIFSPQHDWASFGVLVALLLINGVIGFIEERNAGKAIAALKKSLAPKCSVKRDGVWQILEAKDLVPGDLITIKLGDIVPADCRLLKGLPIEVDQAALTGESLPVTVNPDEVAKSGSIIKKGEIEAMVTATGANTYIGEAMALVAQSDTSQGHFQKVLFDIAKVLIIVSLVLVLVIFFVKVFVSHEEALQVTNLCLVLLVASVPIAMPVVCTGTMAVGSRKLAQKNVIVSRLGAIEELAGMRILCSDKTGTLTLNKLEMRNPWTLPNIEPEQIVLCSALAAKRVNPDAIDTCIVNSIPNIAKLDDYEELAFIPFDPVSKRTEATVRSRANPNNPLLKVTKGAPQVILNMCKNKDDIEEQVELKVKEYAEKGLRTLGVARCTVDADVPEDEQDDLDWEFMGMLTFHDPPRHDTKETVSTAIKMGAEVKMITGDHLLIAKETARLLGMGESFYGKEFLEAVDDGKSNIEGVDIGDIIEAADGFAQVAPKHKYFIVAELQKRGHIVGMTGDGVNDAPALKKADIGIAVEGATEAAKAAADIVLLTPGLSVIITAIIRSRKIFQRMKNYCIYRITCTVQLLFFFTISIIGLNFSIPTITLVLLTLLNDGTVISIAYDNVIPSKKPEAWRLWVITGISIAVGAVATIGLFGIYFLYTLSSDTSHKNFFGYKFSDQCFYSKVFPANGNQSAIFSPHPICYPLCPGYEPISKSCGEYLGWSETITVVYLCLSVGGQLTVFVSRTKHSFWSRRPGYVLLVACIIAQIIATVFCVYWPLKLGITAYIGVPDHVGHKVIPFQVVMKGIDWKMAGFVWVYSIIVFFVEDLTKVYCFYSWDNDNTPDVDIQEIKRKRKPFLPAVKSFFSKKKKSKKEKVEDDKKEKKSKGKSKKQ